MEWTKERPKESGHYFVEDFIRVRTSIVHVEFNSSKNIQVWDFDPEDGSHPHYECVESYDKDRFAWYGPVDPPKCPF